MLPFRQENRFRHKRLQVNTYLAGNSNRKKSRVPIGGAHKPIIASALPRSGYHGVPPSLASQRWPDYFSYRVTCHFTQLSAQLAHLAGTFTLRGRLKQLFAAAGVQAVT